jgi:hypothetical protein
VSNAYGLYADVVGPLEEREQQWRSVQKNVRHRLCILYRSKAEYDALKQRCLDPLPSQLLPKLTASLTRKFFFSLPAGSYLVSNDVWRRTKLVGPLSEREQQWRSIEREMRYHPCRVYENKAQHDLIMQRLQKSQSPAASPVAEDRKQDRQSCKGYSRSDGSEPNPPEPRHGQGCSGAAFMSH